MIPKGMQDIADQLQAVVNDRKESGSARLIEADFSVAQARWLAHVIRDAIAEAARES